MTAQEAFNFGLVDKIVAPEDLMTKAREVAKTIMAKAPIAVMMAKRAINRGLDMDLASGIAYETEAYTTTFATWDRIEGMGAFVEKRVTFQGKRILRQDLQT